MVWYEQFIYEKILKILFPTILVDIVEQKFNHKNSRVPETHSFSNTWLFWISLFAL